MFAKKCDRPENKEKINNPDRQIKKKKYLR
jgi:hypothetical protein